MKTTFSVLALCTAILSGCGETREFFAVEDRKGQVDSAILDLCGEQTNFPKRGGRFAAHVPVECEGSAEIRLRLMNDKDIVCEIGYVTPGAGQTFVFEIVDDECVAQDGGD